MITLPTYNSEQLKVVQANPMKSSPVSLTIRSFDYLANYHVFQHPDSVCKHDEITVTLYFNNVQNGDLGFENELEELLIPYDKLIEWSEDIEGCKTYCRIYPNGKAIVKNVDPYSEGLISIEEVVKAYQANNIASFLQQNLDSQFVMDWKVQNVICENRSLTESHLMYSSNVNVHELTEALASRSRVDKTVLSVNTLPFDKKVQYLLNNGYLAPDCTTPEITPLNF